jgi:segregation and condensation protein B
MTIKLESQIESILFVRTEGVTVSFLSKILNRDETEIKSALLLLQKELEDRGIKLVINGSNVILTTHPEMSEIVSSLFSDEDKGELSLSSLQTLSIILYKGEASRGEISYLRGVDSRMSIRNLLIRGLIERAGKDTYKGTVDVLRFLGVSGVEDLPKWKEVKDALAKETERKDG